MSFVSKLLTGTWNPRQGAAEAAGSGDQVQTKIVVLAALWPPFDAASGVIQNPAPVGAYVIEEVERGGYVIVAPISGHEPYTHVISTGNHDYLAALAIQPTPSETL